MELYIVFEKLLHLDGIEQESFTLMITELYNCYQKEPDYSKLALLEDEVIKIANKEVSINKNKKRK